MSAPLALIPGWARSAVVPHGGAFKHLSAHEIAAPVLRHLLQQTGIAPADVDAVVVGNALGAGGNPARMVALAAGLPDSCAAFSVDTQCCSGIDAISMAVGLLASGQASVVVAGGVEAWSRAPIRMHRPIHDGDAPVAYDRPAFAPDPQRDPDMLESAAGYAIRLGCSPAELENYAIQSHARALLAMADMRHEIVDICGVSHDTYPRALTASRAARLAGTSPRADGCALLVLATPEACKRLQLKAKARWVGSSACASAPELPLVCAELAARRVLQHSGLQAHDLQAIELHDAFAVQGLDFCNKLGWDSHRINRRGGGLARGHPIGASAAIALVRVLTDLWLDHAPGDTGLAAAAGAGGIGCAAVVGRC